MLKLCNIERRALALGFEVWRGNTYLEVWHPGTEDKAMWCPDGLITHGGLTPEDVRKVESGPESGKALIVALVSALRVGTGGSAPEAIRQAERLADELLERGYLEALGLEEPEPEVVPGTGAAGPVDIDF